MDDFLQTLIVVLAGCLIGFWIGLNYTKDNAIKNGKFTTSTGVYKVIEVKVPWMVKTIQDQIEK